MIDLNIYKELNNHSKTINRIIIKTNNWLADEKEYLQTLNNDKQTKETLQKLDELIKIFKNSNIELNKFIWSLED